MPELLVIADDLTGALDTGVQFAKEKIKTVVTTKLEWDTLSLDNAEVLAIDTETRHLQEKEAFDRIKRVLEIAKEKEIKYLYKKTDSTLRGNIGIEFLAIWKTYNRPIMFIPAFPKLKRFTRNGVQYIDDTPINMTSFSKDPLNPVRESYIPKIIEEQAKLKSSIVKRDYYNNISIIDSDVYIFDAELDKDLLTIGETLKRKDMLKITAGCAGFAEILPKLIDFKRDRKQVNLNIKGDYIVIICGSMNERSLKQIEFAKEKLGFLDIVLSKEEISNELNALSEDIFSNKRIVIRAEILRDPKNLHHRILDKLASITEEIYNRMHLNTFIIFGGDTLFKIIERLRIEYLEPVGEIETGVAVSKAKIGEKEFVFITKAGGFGDIDIVTKITDFMKRRSLCL
ncbi:MAG: four-carbon acid sugar kinase family protein [bacterium]